MSARAKLAAATAVVVAVTAYMAYVGASASWKYYLTADECVADAAELFGQRVRVNGKIAPDTLQIASDRTKAHFSLKGSHSELPVVCSGRLPDNLSDGLGVMVEGRLDQTGTLCADKILTRCASKYEPTRPAASQNPDIAVLAGEAP